jgi:spore coat polysaccharide biosynthesis predicted glycosyltransferase SpsG
VSAAELLAAIEVEHLTLQPGDTLVFKSPKLLTRAEFEAIREHVQRVLPDTNVLIVEGGADVAVLRAES